MTPPRRTPVTGVPIVAEDDGMLLVLTRLDRIEGKVDLLGERMAETCAHVEDHSRRLAGVEKDMSSVKSWRSKLAGIGVGAIALASLILTLLKLTGG